MIRTSPAPVYVILMPSFVASPSGFLASCIGGQAIPLRAHTQVGCKHVSGNSLIQGMYEGIRVKGIYGICIGLPSEYPKT